MLCAICIFEKEINVAVDKEKYVYINHKMLYKNNSYYTTVQYNSSIQQFNTTNSYWTISMTKSFAHSHEMWYITTKLNSTGEVKENLHDLIKTWNFSI